MASAFSVLAALALSGCPKSEPGATQGDAIGSDAPSSDALSSGAVPASEKPATPVLKSPAKGRHQADNTASATAAFKERMVERNQMVDSGIVAAGVEDPRVIEAMRKVPRHRFVPEMAQSEAYTNRPLPIGHGQTISQPYIVAAMTEAAAPKPSDRCLEIGTGSGYQAAVLAELCDTVHSIEYLKAVADYGERNLRSLGYSEDRVRLRVGDGYLGWPEAAPFGVVLVTAAPEQVPAPLLEQLALGGRLVIPVGARDEAQTLERWTRIGKGSDASAFRRETLMHVRFVPFLGERANPE